MLNGIIYVPIGTVKATVQIIHGMCEHIELYDEFMSVLAENGIAAFACDQLGHGRTALENELGFIAAEHGSELLINDAYLFAKEFVGDYSGVPHFIFGHSMGSFTARIVSERYPEICGGLILAGTSGPQPAALLGRAVTDIEGIVRGADHRSESSQKLFYNLYNRRFRGERRDYAWLSHDADVISEHENDELFNFTYSVGAMNDVVRLCLLCNEDEWYDNFRKDCPALIISGEEDPLGGYGKGVLEVFRRLDKTAPGNITFKLYSGARHELLREGCKYGVTADILAWINRYIR